MMLLMIGDEVPGRLERYTTWVHVAWRHLLVIFLLY